METANRSNTASMETEDKSNTAETNKFVSEAAGSNAERKKPRAHGFRSFLESDVGQQYAELAYLFCIAYAPYVLPPILMITVLTVVQLGVGFGNLASLLCKDRNVMLTFSVAFVAIVAATVSVFFKLRTRPCYLVDFSAFKSLDERKLTTEVCHLVAGRSQKFSKRNLLFQLKVLLRSGLSDETYGPSFAFKENTFPSFSGALEEMQHVMFGALDELFSKTALKPSQVDVLITQVSTFYPAPSLSSHLVNRYKMREDVKSYSLAGMGCAAGMIALDLAKDILRVYKDKYVVIVGTENITLNWYFGNDRSMLVTNCLFRCGSYALLLSNFKADKQRSKLQLLQSFRTCTSAQDRSYNVIVNREDDEGIPGIFLSINLLDVAAEAVRICMTKLLPSSIPAKELLKTVLSFLRRTVLKEAKAKQHMPDFRNAFNHFLLHPGGRAVIDGIGKRLGLTDYDLEPARMALHRFGNTSSSGLWYGMAYLEAKKRLKKGEKVWQLALGSGFKCNSVVWRVLKVVEPREGYNPWMECIHRYPVEIPQTILPSHPHYKLMKLLEKEAREEAAAAAAESAMLEMEKNRRKEDQREDDPQTTRKDQQVREREAEKDEPTRGACMQ